ncbi:MAG: HAD-IA family hydrolase [Gammaproteobacteria bacterium]|nr:HAD-IA family hydrolase [Gammaproteobacteria bacterium]
MKRTFELVVFDWDGTLMDSESRIVTCMQRAASQVGVAVPDNAAARDVIGLGLIEAVQRLFPVADAPAVAALVDAYRAHWLGDEVVPAPMFAGAGEMIERLFDAGVLLAVATGKSRRGLDKALEESGLGRFFHATRCADEAFSKPHPQMLQDILTDLDTTPGRAVMVGDTEYDMQMARNAGVSAVAVSHGVHAPARLLANGADACFDDLFQLSDWLHGTVDVNGV